MISLFGSNVGPEELAELQDSFEKQWLGIGPKVAQFEKEIAKKVGADDFVLLNSGSNSLHLALKLLELPPGSEVILPSFTWVSCASAILLNNLKPVFCDVDLETCNVRAEDIERVRTPNTSAVMVVHYAGKPVEFDEIQALGLPIIEDAAHSIDSTYHGRHCGTLADVGIFSFDAVKNLTTGEGGGVLAKDPEKLQRARSLRYCGIAKSGFQASANKARWWEYDIKDAFPKMLPNDVAAGIGLAQLKKLPEFQKRRKELWNQYREILSSEPWAKNWIKVPPSSEEHERHSYFTYCIQLRHGSRDDLAHFLFKKKIYTSLRFHPLHLNPIYKHEGKLPNCEQLNETALSLPFHHRLSDSDVHQIFDALKEFGRGYLKSRGEGGSKGSKYEERPKERMRRL